jgi:RNA ligase (TIGR02306 family)
MYKNGERVMAWIAKIDEIQSIPNADAICAYRVGGWWVVDKKETYKVGDLCVYVSIDSWIPTELAPFLSKGKEPRVYNGVSGERLKTVRLRGQISQGLLLPIEVAFPGSDREFWWSQVDTDVSERLGIQKWEPVIPAQLAGQVRGNFPTVIPKTDQERCQNLVKEINAAIEAGLEFEITEKLEGSSCTMYLDTEGEFHVCSRNLDLKFDENNTFWKVAKKYDVENELRKADAMGYAVQGELIGPGVQGNIYKLTDFEFRVFDVYNANEGRYLTPGERAVFVANLGLMHVPLIRVRSRLFPVQDILELAEGKSMLNDKQEREGIVYKEINGGMTFKAISNSYLINQK